MIYETLGRILLASGIMLGCFLGIRLTRKSIDSQVLQESNYLLIASTPEFGLPPATPLPTLTATPIPTAQPPALPPIRLSIPAINLNSSIQEIFPTQRALPGGDITAIWEIIGYAVAHFDSSGGPGGGRNIVLAGHNNTEGEVFRDLDQVSPGDEVILFTEQREFHYRVQKKFLVPYLGVEEEADAKLQSFAAPQSTEMVTLISCWPYATNSHRIVIIAVPSEAGD